MMEPVKIVVRYKDGRIAKGYTEDFSVNRPLFRLYTDVQNRASDIQTEIKVEDLKAVFFVEDFEGNPDYEERKEFVEGDKPSGRKVEVTFLDGEKMQGSTLGYSAERSGFFLFPSDPKGNNMRAFVISSALRDFRFL